jgi:hypothetical protein
MISGAKEIILAKPRSRSSRAIGPKIRLPRGFPSALITIAAFSSKRTRLPSDRWISFHVRTKTARTISER